MADLIDRDELRKDFCNMCEAMQPEMIDCEKKECISMQIIGAQPTVNRWISVEDALPEKDKSYITYSETTKYCNHNEIPEESRINILYFNGEEWYDEECRYYNVTHYMPIPEPPEKE